MPGTPGTNRVQVTPPTTGQRRPSSPNVSADHRLSWRSKPWPTLS